MVSSVSFSFQFQLTKHKFQFAGEFNAFICGMGLHRDLFALPTVLCLINLRRIARFHSCVVSRGWDFDIEEKLFARKHGDGIPRASELAASVEKLQLIAI